VARRRRRASFCPLEDVGGSRWRRRDRTDCLRRLGHLLSYPKFAGDHQPGGARPRLGAAQPQSVQSTERQHASSGLASSHVIDGREQRERRQSRCHPAERHAQSDVVVINEPESVAVTVEDAVTITVENADTDTDTDEDPDTLTDTDKDADTFTDVHTDANEEALIVTDANEEALIVTDANEEGVRVAVDEPEDHVTRVAAGRRLASLHGGAHGLDRRVRDRDAYPVTAETG
jgi:hypothetical protein